jgi:putative tricarboxylic transport membrane protein
VTGERMNKRDLVSGSVWLGVGIFVTIGSVSFLEVGTLTSPAPGLFPFVAGAALSLLSLAILIKAAFEKEKRSLGELWRRSNWLGVFYAIGSLFIYSMLLEWVGFVICTALLLIFLFRTIEPQKWKMAIGVAISSSVGFYLLFDRVLQVLLPKGLFGF